MTDVLKLSTNSKTKFANKPNTIGFLPGRPEDGGTCPGATKGVGGCCSTRPGCATATCYVNKLMRIYSGVGPVLKGNTDMMNDADLERKILLLDNTIKLFKSKNKPEHYFFRWTWSGDINNEDYAKAMVEAAKRHPDVKFWAYTRSYWFAPMFAGLPNFALYLSCDPVNYTEVAKMAEQLKEHKNIGMAWMDTDTKPDGVKWVNCPETSKRIKNEPGVGACSKCQLCFTHNDKIKLRNITFDVH